MLIKSLVIADKSTNLKALAEKAEMLTADGVILAADGVAEELMYYVIEQGFTAVSKHKQNVLITKPEEGKTVAITDESHPLMRNEQ